MTTIIVTHEDNEVDEFEFDAEQDVITVFPSVVTTPRYRSPMERPGWKTERVPTALTSTVK